MHIEIEVIFCINVEPFKSSDHSNNMGPSDSSLFGALSTYYRFIATDLVSCCVKIVINILSRHESFKLILNIILKQFIKIYFKFKLKFCRSKIRIKHRIKISNTSSYFD